MLNLINIEETTKQINDKETLGVTVVYSVCSKFIQVPVLVFRALLVAVIWKFTSLLIGWRGTSGSWKLER